MYDVDAASVFLAERAIEHTALIALVRRAQTTLSLRRRIVAAYDAEDAVCGIILTGLQTIVSHCAPEIVRAFVHSPLTQTRMRALLGPNDAVDVFMRERQESMPPRIDAIQHLFILSNLAVEPDVSTPCIFEATTSDVDTIVAGAAAMIEDELGYDPRQRLTFRREILNQIQARRWWLARDTELRLLCRIGATTERAMQLECIWAPPASRGRGHATRALAAICARLLTRSTSLSLTVNVENMRAIRLYKRLGFAAQSLQRAVLW